jgi:Zn-dependent peptidase ImmA (M78 family)/DNA-binding XRE family transcriptional regulator
MATFNPARLVLARERRGMFGKELAPRCGVTAQTVSNWESGLTVPGGDAIVRLAAELDFPEEFFFRPDFDRMPEGAANFRARTKLPSRQKRSALAAGDLARELASWIEDRFELPPVSLPDLEGQPPELAAQVVRAEWLLGERRIPSMIHLLESRGVLVFSLAQDCQELDAFSFWLGDRPIVLLNTMKTPERSRIDAAHELFHLLAHREETGKQEEEDADAFAGALLMPENDLRKHLPQAFGLNQLIQEKHRWGVSLAALVYRLHRVQIIKDWQYRSLYMELSKRGYRSSEPRSIQREGSALLSKVFEGLRAQGISPRTVASEMGISLEQIQEFLLGLGATLLALDGGGGSISPPAGRPHLKLV